MSITVIKSAIQMSLFTYLLTGSGEWGDVNSRRGRSQKVNAKIEDSVMRLRLRPELWRVTRGQSAFEGDIHLPLALKLHVQSGIESFLCAL